MRFGPDPNALKVGDAIYGIYWLKDLEVHRMNMTREEAEDWLREANEDFPNGNAYAVWGICHARWEVG